MPTRNFDDLVRKYKIPDTGTGDGATGAQLGTPEPGTVEYYEQQCLEIATAMDVSDQRVSWVKNGSELPGVLVATQEWQKTGTETHVTVEIAVIPSHVIGGGLRWNTWLKYNLDGQEHIILVTSTAITKELVLERSCDRLEQLKFTSYQQS